MKGYYIILIDNNLKFCYTCVIVLSGFVIDRLYYDKW